MKNIDIALNLLVYCKPGKAAVMEQHEHHEHNQGSEKLFDPEPEQLLHDQPTASMQRKDGEGAVPGDRGKREVKPGVCFCVQRSAYPLGGGPSVSLPGWLLSPMIVAALAMSLSSASVITNALRLRQAK